MLLRDEKKYQDDQQQVLLDGLKVEERELVSASDFGLRRSVNGRSW